MPDAVISKPAFSSMRQRSAPQQQRTTMLPGSMLRASVVLLAVVPKPSGTSVIEYTTWRTAHIIVFRLNAQEQQRWAGTTALQSLRLF
jgi:hypothetical protein